MRCGQIARKIRWNSLWFTHAPEPGAHEDETQNLYTRCFFFFFLSLRQQQTVWESDCLKIYRSLYDGFSWNDWNGCTIRLLTPPHYLPSLLPSTQVWPSLRRSGHWGRDEDTKWPRWREELVLKHGLYIQSYSDKTAAQEHGVDVHHSFGSLATSE